MTIGKKCCTASISALAAVVALASPCQAAVTISTGTTQNMSCSGGVCQPTASSAVLNVGDLEGYLASGNVEVTTTGSGVEAHNLAVKATVSWSNGSVLSLDAHNALAVDSAVSITGLGGLVLTNSGNPRQLLFGRGGNVRFANVSGSLVINGTSYMLANSVKSLASAISANPSGAFALTNDYDAGGDGTYSGSPILPNGTFEGSFEGLGHRISNLSIRGNFYENVGLFSVVGQPGVLRDIALTDARVIGGQRAGVLAGYNEGLILGTYSTGRIKADITGGLVGLNFGTVALAHSEVQVAARSPNDAGGLVGDNYSIIDSCYATGGISGTFVGGLAATDSPSGAITNSYATGNVQGTGGLGDNYAGGLLGFNGWFGKANGIVTDSYSTGAPTANQNLPGGLVGYDARPAGSMTDTYWDTDTSGITNLSQGAGYPPNDPGITGLSTSQFQSGLPSGFDSKIWAENPKINGGLPYLINNPPPK